MGLLPESLAAAVSVWGRAPRECRRGLSNVDGLKSQLTYYDKGCTIIYSPMAILFCSVSLSLSLSAKPRKSVGTEVGSKRTLKPGHERIG